MKLAHRRVEFGVGAPARSEVVASLDQCPCEEQRGRGTPANPAELMCQTIENIQKRLVFRGREGRKPPCGRGEGRHRPILNGLARQIVGVRRAVNELLPLKGEALGWTRGTSVGAHHRQEFWSSGTRLANADRRFPDVAVPLFRRARSSQEGSKKRQTRSV